MKQQTFTQSAGLPWQWILLALASHIGWGAYPVFSRYLQTVSQVPSFSLLALGNLAILLIALFTIVPRLDKQVFRVPALWAFGFFVVLRGITNLLAARYTLAIYVQLITQMTPFVVALLSRTFLREPLPRYTLQAMTICTGGALLMMSGDMSRSGLSFSLTNTDWIGIGMALASCVALAVYMLSVRRVTRHAVSSEALLVTHLVSLFAFSIITSLVLREDWSRWGQIGWKDWLVFAGFSLGVLWGANLAQIRSLDYLGAPLVSSMLATRLISALVIGGFLLGERLTSGWQVVGTAVVLITITWYLRQQASIQ